MEQPPPPLPMPGLSATLATQVARAGRMSVASPSRRWRVGVTRLARLGHFAVTLQAHFRYYRPKSADDGVNFGGVTLGNPRASH